MVNGGRNGIKANHGTSRPRLCRISLTLEDKVTAKALEEACVDDVTTYEKYGECQERGSEFLAQRCKQIDKGVQTGKLQLGSKWTSDLPIFPPNCPNIEVVTEDETLTVVQGATRNMSALGYRIHLGKGEPDGGSIIWRVLHKPATETAGSPA